MKGIFINTSLIINTMKILFDNNNYTVIKRVRIPIILKIFFFYFNIEI